MPKIGVNSTQNTSEKKKLKIVPGKKLFPMGDFLPGVGVAMFMAGVPIGVFPGVRTGVLPPIWLAGVSSQRDFLLLAPGVGVSPIESPPRSVRGVSAHPLPCPGVSLKKKKKSK